MSSERKSDVSKATQGRFKTKIQSTVQDSPPYQSQGKVLPADAMKALSLINTLMGTRDWLANFSVPSVSFHSPQDGVLPSSCIFFHSLLLSPCTCCFFGPPFWSEWGLLHILHVSGWPCRPGPTAQIFPTGSRRPQNC